MTSASIEVSAHTILERCDLLAGYSEEAGLLIRRFATEPMQRVNKLVGRWMDAAGMSVRQDAIGNLIGRYEADTPHARTLLLGSHLDTVRDAGKYDGPLGVLTALACVERLHARGERLPFAIEVLGFTDEEGLRYRSTYLGSAVVSGTFNPAMLNQLDADGISVAEAIRASGGNPDELLASRRAPDDLLGYVEVHIEQGPVLEALDLPLGVVSNITGHSRIDVTFTGQAGHAGTVPMSMRHDPLCAASEFILAAEALARSRSGLVATVGQLSIQPGASNVIPGKVILSLDLRHQEDALRTDAAQQLEQQANQISASRDLTVEWRTVHETRMTPCTPYLASLFARSIEAAGYPVHSLPSGAGHDAVPMSSLTNIAMLFVRCKAGISHNPAESVALEDVAAACEVMDRFLHLLARELNQ